MLLLPKKNPNNISLGEAVRQARAELRIEGIDLPEWGHKIFSRVESGELSLQAAHAAIDAYVKNHLVKK